MKSVPPAAARPAAVWRRSWNRQWWDSTWATHPSQRRRALRRSTGRPVAVGSSGSSGRSSPGGGPRPEGAVGWVATSPAISASSAQAAGASGTSLDRPPFKVRTQTARSAGRRSRRRNWVASPRRRPWRPSSTIAASRRVAVLPLRVPCRASRRTPSTSSGTSLFGSAPGVFLGPAFRGGRFGFARSGAGFPGVSQVSPVPWRASASILCGRFSGAVTKIGSRGESTRRWLESGRLVGFGAAGRSFAASWSFSAAPGHCVGTRRPARPRSRDGGGSRRAGRDASRRSRPAPRCSSSSLRERGGRKRGAFGAAPIAS